MKITHVVYSLEMGGAEVIVSQLCHLQRSQGHEVEVFSYKELGVIGERLSSEGFKIYVPGPAHPFRTMWRYLKRFLSNRPDVVHCHNVAPTLHAVIPARLAGVRRVITTRHRLELFPYRRSEELRYNLLGWLCHWITGICEVTCVNIRRGLFARSSRIIRVYNGTEPMHRVLEDEGTQPSFTVVFVGRLAPEKALNVLIRAVSLAKSEVPHLRFWIVGDGRSRPELEAMVRDLDAESYITFWGQQTNTAPFFSGANIFVMSSIQEGLPMSLLQSMSLGTPAILTDVDGNGEVLRLTGGGLLVPMNDSEAFAAAIVQLASNGSLLNELGQRALAGYEAMFTLQMMAANYMNLYVS